MSVNFCVTWAPGARLSAVEGGGWCITGGLRPLACREVSPASGSWLRSTLGAGDEYRRDLRIQPGAPIAAELEQLLHSLEIRGLLRTTIEINGQPVVSRSRIGARLERLPAPERG